MRDEDSFIRSYCYIAGVGEAAARSAYILFDALHDGAAPPVPGAAPLARIHASAATRKSAPSGTGRR